MRRKVPRASQGPVTDTEGLSVLGSLCYHTVLVKKKNEMFRETGYLTHRKDCNLVLFSTKRSALLKIKAEQWPRPSP